ncbi:3-isopropylmalate dehydrogenase [Romeria aff. gracilis LEGE 07310]|uniref:3-isopropylmalate dehydrogenase n=1 Tax=Vasconcelosia minhoensis LEGE 07310 TaxID=915328 RepID=A0A8J7DNU4_9CYAN|nr:3-isopropylmalate dehydrogenase [Romeria gracilis]MBE9078635.1 3-isopropylmalate dehydrogenase [Romeria aff. gracilis LEGE 07310]
MPRHYRIVSLPGEGIGPEVVDATLAVLQQVAQLHSFTVAVEYGWLGQPAVQRFGRAFPQETARQCEGCDGIVLGAVTQGLLEIRQHFNLFINLRPVRPTPCLFPASALKSERLAGVDILFVRELASGIYFGESGRGNDSGSGYGYHTMRYADAEIRRIAKAALNQAQQRRHKLTVAHKENALPQIPWTALVHEEARDFPNILVEPMLADNLAMQLILKPQQFDVVLAGNLFGDILSDIGGALTGSIGLLGSASLNGQGFGLYEPIHGTAPDIAGKGIANPLGAIASIVLMLQQWGETTAAQQILDTQETLLSQGYCTADLCSQRSQTQVTTQEFTDLFLENLRQNNS